MQSIPLSLTNNEYFKLGRLCAKQKPEVAKELLSIYEIKPVERDHARIATLFSTFCHNAGVEISEYQGRIFKGSKSDHRKCFMAAMARLYLPHLYAAPAGSIRLDRGFISSLASTLQLTKMCVAKVVKEVVVQEKVYPEFKAAVDEVTSKLISHE